MSGPSPLCALKPKATAAPALMHFGDPDPPPDVEHEYETDDEPGHDEWIQMMEATPGGVAIEKDDAADADAADGDVGAAGDVHAAGEYEEEEEEEMHAKDEEIDPAGAATDEVPPGDDEAKSAQKKLHEEEFEEDEKDRNDLKKFVETEHDKKSDQGWDPKYRNKGYNYNNGYKGNKKWHGKSWYGKGWQKGKGKGKGYRWQKWHQDWSHNQEDWGKHHWWDPHAGDEKTEKQQDAGVVLQQCKKGGYYLPKGQGYLDPDGNYHPQLGFDQSFSQMGKSTPISKHMGRKHYSSKLLRL